MTCAFFGHRDCPDDIIDSLKATILDLIENNGVKRFLVGNNGNFDRLVIKALKKCKEVFPHIDYCVVLAYLPSNNYFEYPTIFPEKLESVPKKIAILKRNKWIVENCDFVIMYISHSFGGAYKSIEYAKRLGKPCINLHIT